MNVLFVNGAKCSGLLGISYYNPTFLYGVSCFEGVRAYWNPDARTLVFLDLDEHLQRLYRSASFLSFIPPILMDDLKEQILQIARIERIQQDSYARITFYLGGDGSWHSSNDIHYMVSIRSMRSELGTRAPAAVGITRFRRIADDAMPAYVKAGANYLNSRYAMMDVRDRGFDDALFLTKEGVLSESTGSTLFLFKGGQLHTPSLDCDILPGITRARLIRLCKKAGLHVIEERIPPSDLDTFDGAILTGTMVEIRPVARIDSQSMAPSSPLHEKLYSLFREFAMTPGPWNCHVDFRQ
jgi:branched-chain amino acid aminotransferase